MAFCFIKKIILEVKILDSKGYKKMDLVSNLINLK